MREAPGMTETAAATAHRWILDHRRTDGAALAFVYRGDW